MALEGVNICDHDLVGLADFKNSSHSGVLCDSPWFGGGRLSPLCYHRLMTDAQTETGINFSTYIRH